MQEQDTKLISVVIPISFELSNYPSSTVPGSKSRIERCIVYSGFI